MTVVYSASRYNFSGGQGTICDLEKVMTGSAQAVTEKALDDIDHGIGLSKVYKDTDEMFRDLGA